MQTSVIIPTLNEAENIQRLVRRIKDGGGPHLTEVIVVDAGSCDETLVFAKTAGAKVICSHQKSRAIQMNLGAQQAKGDILYFVHGDTLPPLNYMNDIQQAISEGFPAGCFRFRFDSNRRIFIFNNYITRFNKIFVRGGDQSLYVRRDIFDKLGGYRQDYIIMEDYDFITKIQRQHPFKVIPNDVIISARKYETNSYLKVQLANVTVFTMYRLGFSQARLANTYKRMLDYR